jgi:hypothetical protein
MLLTVLVCSIAAILMAALVAGALTIRRRQNTLNTQREASQLQRRADHLFKIALAAQVHTRNNAIARALLDEAVRVLTHSFQLDSSAEATRSSLRECYELIASIDVEPESTAHDSSDPLLQFPETELIEAQLHLTEASRLLIGLERRGQITYDTLSAMTIALKQAQRALELRLQLYRATHTIEADRNSPKLDEAALAGEYLAAMQNNRAHSSH